MEKYKVGDSVIVKTLPSWGPSSTYVGEIMHIRPNTEPVPVGDVFEFYAFSVEYLVKLTRLQVYYRDGLYPAFETEILGLATELGKALYGEV